MNKITQMLMEIVSELSGKPAGAYNIREDGQCAGRQSTDHIRITPKTSEPGIDIRVLPGTMGESVYIPACITHAGVNDLVYNDFYIGDGADGRRKRGTTASTVFSLVKARMCFTWKSMLEQAMEPANGSSIHRRRYKSRKAVT